MTFEFLLSQNSMNHKTPVRVIRGHVDKLSYTGKVYTFDGLYEVCLMVPTSTLVRQTFSDVTVYRFSFHTYCSRTRSNPLQRWGELSFNIPDLFELWSVNLVVGTEFMWLDNVGRCFMFHFYVSCTSMHFILVPTFLLCSSFLACPSTDPSDSKSVQWKHFPFSYSHRTVPPSISNQAT